VRPDDFRAFKQALAERLARDDRVLGLVFLGSAAERDYAPDDWSDHDFFVITSSGEQDAFRADRSWVPRSDELALWFRETEHGVKALYEDGHLVEFAVFDLDELGVAAVDRWRVVFDRGGVEERMAEVAAQSARPDPDPALSFGQLVTTALVGAGRHRRGELLTGRFFVSELAVRHFVELVLLTVPSTRLDTLDRLDRLRRFEVAFPELGEALAALQRLPSDQAAITLLRLADRELRPRLPELEWHALDVVLRRLGG
jgi:predicted nucleotidyltransferase